jgi:murein DD-endopeptidase MepM/ murein hydrolase activator NlpD
MAKRFYTCIIVPNASARLHKLRIPEKALYALATVGVISFFIATALGFTIARMAFQISDYAQLEAENKDLKIAKANLEVATKRLDSRIQNLETRSEALTRILENDKVMKPVNAAMMAKGTGGAKAELSTADLVNKSGSPIDLMKDRTVQLESQLTMLEQKVTFREGLLRATPSIWPVKGPIGSYFGRRRDPFTGEPETHKGLDIIALYGSRVLAPADGKVLVAGREGDYGNLVILDHGNGVTTRFAHLARFQVQPGTAVRRGDVIGYVGSTGRTTAPHLHYEVRLYDRTVNPTGYLP